MQKGNLQISRFRCAAKNVIIIGASTAAACAFLYYGNVIGDAGWTVLNSNEACAEAIKNDTAARSDFLQVADVFFHPRCKNCHPTGESPLQGDEGTVHTMNVKRGSDGHGKGATRCGNCHQASNTPGTNMPPGAPDWHMPGPEIPMVFENKTPGELCRQLKDPAKNGGKTLEEIIRHVTVDPLVLWGWNPGEGRTVPRSHDEFAKKMKVWADNRAACPDLSSGEGRGKRMGTDGDKRKILSEKLR